MTTGGGPGTFVRADAGCAGAAAGGGGVRFITTL